MRRRRVNPFYVLLTLAATAFCVTACAYGVMAVKQLHAAQPAAQTSQEDDPFVTWMDRHGASALIVELGVLAVATVAAMATDRYWTGKGDAAAQGERK